MSICGFPLPATVHHHPLRAGQSSDHRCHRGRSLPVLAEAFRLLNVAGKTPLWSSGRTFDGIAAAGVTRWSPAAAFPPGAAYSEEAAIEAFAGLRYWRYYEFWMWQAGAATCGAQIANALREQALGVPIVAITPSCPKPEHGQGHSTSGGHGPCGGQVPKSMAAFFNFSAAAFLVVASPHSYWGFQVRGYFLVFVQLFEKYGTLIERYTALIEKVSALIGLNN